MPEKLKSIESAELQQENTDTSSEILEQVDSSGEVADLLEGVDMGNVSETVKDKKEGDSNQKTGGQQQKSTTPPPPPKPVYRPLPSTNVMRRSILKNMQQEEAHLLQEAAKVEKNAFLYTQKIKEARSLRRKISDFLSLSLEKIKEQYLKLFGKKHGIEEETKI